MVFNLILVLQIILFGKPSSKPLLASAYSPMQYEYWPWVQECCAPWRREGPHGANALLSADRQVDCLAEVVFRHYSESAQFALCAFQMSSGAWSTWVDQVPNSRFIAQSLFTVFSAQKRVVQPGGGVFSVAFEKKIIPSPPPPHILGCTMGPKCCLCPMNNRSGTPLPILRVLDAKEDIAGTHRS